MNEATYREASARCPRCAVPMESRLLADCTVDVCADCKGLWVDWLDGELPHVATEVGPLSVRPGLPTAEVGLVGAGCPRCLKGLVLESLLGTGPLIFRCGDCGGAFIPRSSLDALMASAWQPPPKEGAPSSFERTVQAILKWLEELVGKPTAS